MNTRKVYTFKFPGDRAVSGLAMNCHVKGDHLRFYDTIRGHMIPGEVTEDGPDGFTFREANADPAEWTFKVLTIEDFRRDVCRIVENGDVLARVIKTTADLHEWYRKTYGEDAGLFYGSRPSE